MLKCVYLQGVVLMCVIISWEQWSKVEHFVLKIVRALLWSSNTLKMLSLRARYFAGRPGGCWPASSCTILISCRDCSFCYATKEGPDARPGAVDIRLKILKDGKWYNSAKENGELLNIKMMQTWKLRSQASAELFVRGSLQPIYERTTRSSGTWLTQPVPSTTSDVRVFKIQCKGHGFLWK